MITKPMLATAVTDLATLRYPVLCTPKLDGFRCLKVNGQALTRSFKPVRNRFVREWIEANCPDGVDGELLLRHGTFSETASAIGRESGQPDFVFMVFDYVGGLRCESYERRMEALHALPASERVVKVLPRTCNTEAKLLAFEAECLEAGYEGVMLRAPGGPYKCGRSTETEGWLLKLKRFADAEAVVVGTYEGQTNLNAPERDAFGRTKRSTAQAGMIGRGELGGYVVRDVATGVEFNLGHNATRCERSPADLWRERAGLVGRWVKYQYQPSGMKTAPRFPQFLGFRPEWDRGEAPTGARTPVCQEEPA
jgi:DNA ligase-1